MKYYGLDDVVIYKDEEWRIKAIFFDIITGKLDYCLTLLGVSVRVSHEELNNEQN